MSALLEVEALDLHLRWDGSAKTWTVECRAAKATGTAPGPKIGPAAAAAPLAAYSAALDAMPAGALRAGADRDRVLLRALRAALTELGADLTGGAK